MQKRRRDITLLGLEVEEDFKGKHEANGGPLNDRSIGLKEVSPLQVAGLHEHRNKL